MIIAGFDEFHQVSTLSVEYLPKSDNSGQFDGKSQKKINLLAILKFPSVSGIEFVSNWFHEKIVTKLQIPRK